MCLQLYYTSQNYATSIFFHFKPFIYIAFLCYMWADKRIERRILVISIYIFTSSVTLLYIFANLGTIWKESLWNMFKIINNAIYLRLNNLKISVQGLWICSKCDALDVQFTKKKETKYTINLQSVTEKKEHLKPKAGGIRRQNRFAPKVIPPTVWRYLRRFSLVYFQIVIFICIE